MSVIGLGTIGAAVAHAFLDGGLEVAVWNRSPGRIEPLVEAGAHPMESAEAALLASPVAVLCVGGYDASRGVLSGLGIGCDLDGRTVVDFSIGVPADALEGRSLVEARGGTYLDGQIPVYPWDIGREDTMLIFAGPRDLWERHEQTLRCLGGASRHIGEGIAAPNALTVATGSFYHATVLAYFEALAFAETQAVPLEDVFRLAAAHLDVIADVMRWSVDALTSRDGVAPDPEHLDRSAILATHREGLEMFREAIAASGASTALLDSTIDYLAGAEVRGLARPQTSASSSSSAGRSQAGGPAGEGDPALLGRTMFRTYLRAAWGDREADTPSG